MTTFLNLFLLDRTQAFSVGNLAYGTVKTHQTLRRKKQSNYKAPPLTLKYCTNNSANILNAASLCTVKLHSDLSQFKGGRQPLCLFIAQHLPADEKS